MFIFIWKLGRNLKHSEGKEIPTVTIWNLKYSKLGEGEDKNKGITLR